MVNYISFFILLLGLNIGNSQITKDKALHFLGGNLYGLVGAGIANELSNGNRTWTFVGSIGGSLIIGLAKEAIDQNQYGGWDNGDLLVTVLGGDTMGVTIDIFKKRKQRKRDELFKKNVGFRSRYYKEKSPLTKEKINSLGIMGISFSVRYRK